MKVENDKQKTDRHGEWYHFHENAWSWNDKTVKIIVKAPKGHHMARGWRVLWGVTKLAPSRV